MSSVDIELDGVKLEPGYVMPQVQVDEAGNACFYDMGGWPCSRETVKWVVIAGLEYLRTHSDEDIAELIEQQNYENYKANQSLQSSERKAKPTVPGYIYILKQSDLYKIGKTKDIKSRLNNYRTHSATPTEIVCYFRDPDMAGQESRLHKRYTDKRVRGEWFALTDEDIGVLKEVAEISNAIARGDCP